jgi:CelD/BcsL family acetyltransferase involved in cellulose biosynthesis
MSALQEPWTTLLAETPGASVFLAWEWISTWWRHYGQGHELWLLTARNGAGKIVGLAPLMLASRHGGVLCLRRLRFMGSGLVCPCHVDIIARPEEKESVCAAFLSYLCTHKTEWDILDLESMAQSCALGRHLAGANGRCDILKDLVCPFISLPGSWDVYHAGLKKKLRRNLRYFRGRLEREYANQVAFHRVTRAEELPLAMDSLVAMHQERWHARDQTTCFDNVRYVEFHRDLAALTLGCGWLRFYQLQVADRTIAALYCFRYQDTLYAYQIGFDPDWGTYSPGRLLIAHVIKEAIGEGVHEFDWLRGGHEYKFEWANGARRNSCFLFSVNWRGRLWSLGASAMRTAGSIGARMLPQPLRRKIRRLLTVKRQELYE